MTGQNNVIKIIFLVLSIYTFIPLLNSQESDEVEQSAGLPETIKIGKIAKVFRSYSVLFDVTTLKISYGRPDTVFW